nr:PREDICTED: E3 ubiquitin-protein ligase LNX isoform X2 [Latimeria chalumnae]|eukprot:XP_014347665.1 PREDICTED: E3 ubiquitin-protein ligase LNX isoform X2 [Latimeria chalumnae]
MSQQEPAEDINANEPELCLTCGQPHLPEENHCYTYPNETDDDLICHICLQPLIKPIDTPCGHTYCTFCLTNFLFEKDFCPMDRKHVMLQICKKSNILVNKLLDKLLVSCPFMEHCTQILQRCDLEAHLKYRCKGASHYGLYAERKRRPQDNSPDGSSELTVAALSSEPSACATVEELTDSPGLLSPALSPNGEDNQSGSSSGVPSRANSRKFRNFERSSARSRSFKKLNRAFSVLRRTKSGGADTSLSEGERDAIQGTGSEEEVLPRLHHLIPDGEITSIKIIRSYPTESLAISIVGGNESPLVCIVIQDVYREGVIARDGRLLPGDMILKVNGIDISNVPHNYALSVLKQPCQVLRLTVLREQRYRCRNGGHSYEMHCPRNDSFHITLNKSSHDEQLGIKLVRRPEEPGIFVFNLLEGGVALRDGQIQENDRVLAINGIDLRHGTPEIAAQLIQASEERVHFMVSRQARQRTPDILQVAGWNNNGSPPPCPDERNSPNKNLFHAVTCHEKIVCVTKDPQESLGMTVAGGVSSRGWDLPIYVANIDPDGVVGRDARIKKGDVLLSVNGIELIGVTRSEAVATIKNTSSPMVLKALEMKECENEDVDNQPFLDTDQASSSAEEWSPAWVTWLRLPRYLYNYKEIVLRRSTAGSLGFSIVGGYEESNRNQPFFIKSIVEGTPAYHDGRISKLISLNMLMIKAALHNLHRHTGNCRAQCGPELQRK